MGFFSDNNRSSRHFPQRPNESSSRSDEILARYQQVQEIRQQRLMAENIQGQIPLGYVNNSELLFGLRPNDAPKNVLVLGLPGTGKTNACRVLVDGFLKNTDATIVFFDKKGSEKSLYPYLTQVLDKSQILYLSPEKNLCENPFCPPDRSINYQEWYRIICNVLLPSLGIRFEAGNALIAGAYKAKKGLPDGVDPCLFDIYPQLLELRPRRYDEHVKADYYSRGEFRLEMCLMNQQKGFSYRRGMPFGEYRKKRFMGIDLSRTDDFTSKLIVESFVAKIFHYQMAQGRDQDASWALLFDEAQHYYSSEKIQTFSGISPLEEMIRQTRSTGIWQILANQSYSSLSHGARTMAGCKILFKIDPTELRYIKESMGLSDEETATVDSLNTGEAIVKLDSRPGTPVFKITVPEFKVRKDVTISNIFEPIHERYDCLPIPEEERIKVINQILGEKEKPQQAEKSMPEIKKQAELNDSNKTNEFLVNIAEKPFLQFTERLNDLKYGGSIADADRIKKLLIDRDYVKEYKIKLKKGRGSKASYLELSSTGKDILVGIGYKISNHIEGKSGFLHSLIVHKLVKPFYEMKYQVNIEGENKGYDCDLAVYEDKKKLVAVEVSYTTNADDEIRNIKRNMDAGYEKVQIVVVASSKDDKSIVEDENKAMAKKQSFIESFKATLDEKTLQNIQVLTLKEFRDLT